MIEARDITRRYGDFTAVKGVSFSVDEGEIVGILGPNGAGKTTIIRMVTGFLPPSSGRVTVGDRDLFEEPRSARRHIGYLPENVALYGEMRVREYLTYRARLEEVARSAVRGAIDEVLESCLLTEVSEQIIGTLSKGYRQRVGLAAAILHSPRVLVLDEPTVGLDPRQIVAIRELIRELGRRHTILLSTHILPEVELLCDRVLIIDQGEIVGEGTPEALRQQWVGTTRIRLTLKGEPSAIEEELAGLEGVESVERSVVEGDTELRLECGQEVDLREALFRLAVERGWVLLELAVDRASLEDVFVRLTTRAAAAAAAATTEEVA
ncbi:MAG: ATP-binding cassette domain-containing protein [Thermoanaerobaculia bacterium]|nr:ATP-binding cassette domain-containing protein [Thermoanaerobaculia bacterium]